MYPCGNMYLSSVLGIALDATVSIALSALGTREGARWSGRLVSLVEALARLDRATAGIDSLFARLRRECKPAVLKDPVARGRLGLHLRQVCREFAAASDLSSSIGPATEAVRFDPAMPGLDPLVRSVLLERTGSRT